MKTYNAPQAQVVRFDNDYVATTTAPSTSATSESAGFVTNTDIGELVNPK